MTRALYLREDGEVVGGLSADAVRAAIGAGLVLYFRRRGWF